MFLMYTKITLTIVTCSLLVACNESDKREYSLAKDSSGHELLLPIKKVITGLSTPESVTVTTDGKLLVSNIGGEPVNSNKLGFISVNSVPKISELDDPKGMALLDKELAILSDHPNVKLINIKTNEVLFSLPIAGAGFLNDAVALSASQALLSDTGTGHIYKIEKTEANSLSYSTFIDASQLNGNGVNGLFVNDSSLFLITSSFGGDKKQGHLYQVELDSDYQVNGNIIRVSEDVIGNGNLDGIIGHNGLIFISDWESENSPASIHVFDDELYNLRYTISGNFKSPADIALDINRKVIYIPEFTENTVSELDISKLKKVD